MIGNKYIQLTPAECAACIDASGDLDVSGTAKLNSAPLLAGFWLFRTPATGTVDHGLWYDATGNTLSLIIGGSAVIVTTDIAVAPAAPTFQNWIPGDQGDWRVWCKRSVGGARSMGIRWVAAGAAGLDTVGVAAGAPLAPISSAIALGSSSTQWGPTNTRTASSTSQDITARGVFMGDSIIAPYRSDVPGTASRMYSSGVVVSLAQAGATCINQLATLTASRYLGDPSVVYGAIQCGTNDLNGGASVATTMTRLQNIVNAWNAANVGAPFFVLGITPGRFGQSDAAYQQRQDVNSCIMGVPAGGGSALTGCTGVVAHVALMGDAHGALLYRYTTTDSTHPSTAGRTINATYGLVNPLITAGITP